MPPPSSTSMGVVWMTTSVHGNVIYLYERDWEHLKKHPEMIGREDEIKLAVESPTLVREGKYPDSCAFDSPSTTNPEGIRVLVQHETELFLQGGTTGWVTTAFDVSTKRFPNPRLGKVLGTYPKAAGENKS
jgi:hypothetical protein